MHALFGVYYAIVNMCLADRCIAYEKGYTWAWARVTNMCHQAYLAVVS